jgi:hypothetical protein
LTAPKADQTTEKHLKHCTEAVTRGCMADRFSVCAYPCWIAAQEVPDSLLLFKGVQNMEKSIRVPTTMSRSAKIFLSLSTGRLWASFTPSGAVRTLTAAIPTSPGR